MSEQQNLFQDTFSAEYAKYLVHSRQEIAQILRGLMQKNELVTAYFNQGKEFFLTSFIEIDGKDHLILDCGTNVETNRRALSSDKIIFVTSQNRIKVQFSTTALHAVQHAGRPAFSTAVPTAVLKLQRREYYRLVAPIRAPLHCLMPDLNGSRFEATVVDISVGGLGLGGFSTEMGLEVGQVFSGCKVALPEQGTVVSALEVRNIQAGTNRSGTAQLRIGCFFNQIPPPHQAMIQRYIIQVDRERSALTRGR